MFATNFVRYFAAFLGMDNCVQRNLNLLSTTNYSTLRIFGMSWCVKTAFLETPGVSLGGSGLSIGGVKIVRAICFLPLH